MMLTPYSKKDLKIEKTYTDNMRLINEFLESGLDCAKVEGWTHKNPDYCSSSLNRTIKSNNKRGIRAIVRERRVYLIKE